MKIQLTAEELALCAESGFKQFNDIAVVAFKKAFNYSVVNTARIFLNKKTLCIKTQPSTNTYPELKEKVGANTADYYLLVTINAKEGIAYLEGWTTRDQFISDKNLNLDKDTYYMSYKDLNDINTLKW